MESSVVALGGWVVAVVGGGGVVVVAVVGGDVVVVAEPAAPPPAAAPAADSRLDQLKELGELKAAGVLTDAEFQAEKAKVLAG